MSTTPMRVTVNEPIDLKLTAERDVDNDRWVIICHGVSCGTAYVYPDDAYEEDPSEVGDVPMDLVATAIGETRATTVDYDDLHPYERELIIRLFTEDGVL